MPMRSIAEARAEARKVFERHVGGWAWGVAAGSTLARLPLSISLQPPTGDDALDLMPEFRDWAAQWRSVPGVTFATRRFRHVGTQSVPARLILEQAADVASFVGESPRWSLLLARFDELLTDWPSLGALDAGTVKRLASVSAGDWHPLAGFLIWSAERDLSQLLPRQIAYPGVDSKWFDRTRTLLVALRRAGAGATTLETRQLDARILVRVLDPALRATIGGLSEFSAPAADLARLSWQPTEVIISENRQNAHSFGDRSGCVVLAAQGYAVDVFGSLPWLRTARVRYWGDLDTHGFAILNRLRHHVPRAESVLMDVETLTAHLGLWSVEEKTVTASLPLLTAAETAAVEFLRANPHTRLEQERLPWPAVEAAFS